MQITPIEIRQKRFEKKFRGYHTEEVDAFLHSLSYTWEKLTTQLNELKASLETYKKDINRLESLEDALLKTVRDGETTAIHLVEQAKRECELMAKEATIQIDQMIHEAKEQVQALEVQTRNELYQSKERLEQELVSTKLALQETLYYKESILRQLQTLGQELLAKSQGAFDTYAVELARKD